ncbi:acetoacetate--CoA ligase [Ilumatobacter nonamiensis]|uniref:acetoacetate--CoA ligase n=1 Tax=Ilumatobacter nonamiensis TaxID=467093 RepID=UPI0003490AFF
MIWEPAADAWHQSRLGDFARHVGSTGGPTLTDYEETLRWSFEQPGAFWRSVADWTGVRFHSPPSETRASSEMPGTRWFPGATLNHAELALRQASLTPDETAIVSVSQSRARVVLSWAELTDQVARCRMGLVERGVGRGDRVVAYLPNIAETTVAFLAVASLGAIWSSCAPEFGVRAVTDRWTQVEPTLLLTVDGYWYGSKHIDRSSHVAQILDALPSLEHVVRLPYLDPDGDDGWSTLLDHDPGAAAAAMAFESVPFDHPLYVLFSSGTTGLPKPIVHGHGGITLEHAKALALHYDLGPGDRFTWFTTTGWMMWNFLTSAALVGATAVLFDGDPGAPDLSTLWRLAADEEVDVVGVSAPFVMACRKADLHPGAEFDLSHLRHLGSTGAPLPAEGFEWIHDEVGADVQIGSLSGGTDVCTGFVGPAPTVPVRVGEISTRMLGCDVQAFRPDGSRCAPGETGELVITQPMPSMPVGFWGDDDGSRLRSAYFEDFDGVWTHGDWITFTDTGGCIITGRSDATLNRGGVRLGTSDFYTVVESLPDVADSIVVHLEDREGGPGELILLLALVDGAELSNELIGEIRRQLRTELSPRHVPDTIDQIPTVPRTLSGKKLEVPVKAMLLGTPAADAASRDSLADPAALDAITAWIGQRATSGGRHQR